MDDRAGEVDLAGADDLAGAVDLLAGETMFSGAVRVDRGDELVLAAAYGQADRAHGVPNTVDTQFATASATKGLTALTVVSLVEDGVLGLGTTARSLLGNDLPLISADVTVEHLLSHRSGIGDYLDESAGLDATDYVMPVSVHELATTESFLRVLDGHPTVFAAGERFAYCNGGYVVLALLAERATATSFVHLVAERVTDPAAMHDTAFLRSDELPGRAAVGYLRDDSPRTNVFHLPVVGNGDGGIYSTLADVRALWGALFAGRIVAMEWVAEMTRPRSVESPTSAYGLGLWLDPSSDAVILEGADAGVSFRSVHRRATDTTYTVVSNTTSGAWPIARLLEERCRGDLTS